MKQEIIDILYTLLRKEYLQRDVYETYSYYLFGPSAPAIQQHLKEHLQEEQGHIATLQRYLAHLGAAPLLDRLDLNKYGNIPGPISFKKILEWDLKLEESAVSEYTKIISLLESKKSFTSLRIELENILIQEQEHVHDIAQWLRAS